MAWGHVASSSKVQTGAGSITSLSITTPTAITTGNLSVFTFIHASTTTVTSVTDTAGNTWKVASDVQAGGANGHNCSIYYAVITAGGGSTNTVTLNLNSADFPTVAIDEYTFTPGSIIVGTPVTGSGNPLNSITLSSVAYTAPTALYLSVCFNNNSSNTATPSAGWTVRESQLGIPATSFGFYMADIVAPTSSPQSITWTVGGAATVNLAASALTLQSTGDIGGSSLLMPGF